MFKKCYPVKIAKKLDFCPFLGPFSRFFECLIGQLFLKSNENLHRCQLKLAAQAGKKISEYEQMLPGQIWQKLVKMGHFVRALRITFPTCILSTWNYFHRFPLNFSFPASIHLICFIAIQFFTPQSFLKNLQRASIEKRVLLSSFSWFGL